MADLSISDLARMVGVPVERLLEQIKEAGLPQSSATDTISNEQRSALLAFLKSRHGDSYGGDTAPRKITLKRKTVETLKTSDNQGRSKSVSVEVRKKRTYVKRSVEEAQKEAAERERQAAEEKARLDAERAQKEAEAKAREEQEAKARAQSGAEAPPAAPAESAKPESRADARKGTLKKDGGKRPGDDEGEVRKTVHRKKEKEVAAPKKLKGVRVTEDFI